MCNQDGPHAIVGRRPAVAPPVLTEDPVRFRSRRPTPSQGSVSPRGSMLHAVAWCDGLITTGSGCTSTSGWGTPSRSDLGEVSHHLKLLAAAGLVHGDRRGKWVWYSLDRQRLNNLQSALQA